MCDETEAALRRQIEEEDLETQAEHREFEKFRGERHLRFCPHVMSSEILPWLYRKKVLSGFWRDYHEVRPPFCDHPRAFSSSTGRLVVLMPYLVAVRKELGMSAGVDDQLVLEGALRESQKFAEEHGLIARVLKRGWHSPEVITIEYTKA